MERPPQETQTIDHAVPVLDFMRLATVVSEVADGLGDAAARAQMSAAADVIANAAALSGPPAEREPLEAAAEAALASDDLDAAVAAAAELAAFDRARIRRVDWSAASGS